MLNYTAAARHLDVGDAEPVAVALRRYAEDLPEHGTESRDARVTMRSGLALVDADEPNRDDALLAVGDRTLVADSGSLTGVLVAGDVDATTLAHVLGRLTAEDIRVDAAGVAGGALVVVTERRDGPDTVRIVEDALSAVPL